LRAARRTCHTPEQAMTTQDQTARAYRFHGVSFNPIDRSTHSFDRGGLDAELADPAVFSWVDIEGPDIAPMNEVMRKMGIDLVLVSHFDEPEVLPRIVERLDCLAFYLYPIYEPERYLDTGRTPEAVAFARMILVVGADFVITYHQRSLDVVEEVKGSCVDSFHLAGKTPGFITFLFLQHCLYDYAHVNLANDNFLDLLQAHEDGEKNDQGIATAGQNILTLKKLAASLHIVLMLLGTKRNRFISDDSRNTFREMLGTAQSVRAAVDSSRDMLDGILHDIQAAAANRTSQIMNVLTIVSAIMLPLTLMVGVYGMNFEYMPGVTVHWGFWALMVGMVTLACTLLATFRRLGWLGGQRSQERAAKRR
jgi:magnesium transporter